jgi:hypothetical protein
LQPERSNAVAATIATTTWAIFGLLAFVPWIGEFSFFVIVVLVEKVFPTWL